MKMSKKNAILGEKNLFLNCFDGLLSNFAQKRV